MASTQFAPEPSALTASRRAQAVNDTDALELLKHLMNALTGDGAMDEPMPFSGRSHTGGTMDLTTGASLEISNAAGASGLRI